MKMREEKQQKHGSFTGMPCQVTLVGGRGAIFAETQSTPPFGGPPFLAKHPQDNFSLQNTNEHL